MDYPIFFSFFLTKKRTHDDTRSHMTRFLEDINDIQDYHTQSIWLSFCNLLTLLSSKGQVISDLQKYKFYVCVIFVFDKNNKGL